MTKSVIIADDRQNWREMYVQALRSAFPDVKIDEVESGVDLVKRILEGDYSVVLSDNDMEDKGAGLKALRRNQRIWERSAILFAKRRHR